jgi:hypothetical protein
MTSSVSLIVDAAITRLDALDAVALATRSPVTDRGTSSARIALAGGATAAIEIPKFGEAPPLAIDVSAPDDAAARAAADALLLALSTTTDWPITRHY